MDGLTPSTLRMLAVGLSYAREPLPQFSSAIRYYADKVEDPAIIDGFLAELKMAHDRGVVARHAGVDDLRVGCSDITAQPVGSARATLALTV
jgi:hypothetical protein